jgi:hypothetical protein
MVKHTAHKPPVTAASTSRPFPLSKTGYVTRTPHPLAPTIPLSWCLILTPEVPPVRGILLFLSFGDWVMSLSSWSSQFIDITACLRISFPWCLAPTCGQSCGPAWLPSTSLFYPYKACHISLHPTIALLGSYEEDQRLGFDATEHSETWECVIPALPRLLFSGFLKDKTALCKEQAKRGEALKCGTN